MRFLIAERNPAIELALDKLQTIQVTEFGKPVRPAMAPLDGAMPNSGLDGGPALIIAATQTDGARAFLERHPNAGLLVIGAGTGCGAKGLQRRLIAERLLDARHIAAFGVRRWSLEEREFVLSQRVQFYSMVEISREGLAEMADAVMMYVRQWPAFYLVLHLDAVDPAFAPGLRTPSAGGLTSRELIYLLQRLLLIQSLGGAELIVDAKTDDATCQLVAQLIAEFS
jgi:hypothetical protein